MTLPDTQVATDTTDISAFGVPLKLIASQDVGGRDGDLLDHVIAVLEPALSASRRSFLEHCGQECAKA